MGLLLALLLLNQGDALHDLRDSDPEVRRNACDTLARKGVKSAIPAIIELLGREEDPKVKEEAAASLARLTGKDGFGAGYAAWAEWWENEGRKSFPIAQLSTDEVNRVVQPRIDDFEAKVDRSKHEIRTLTFMVIIVAFLFVLVMIYFVGHVSSRLREWKEVFRQAGSLIEESKKVSQRTDRVLEELEAKKGEILEFVKKVKEEKEAEIERYSDLLQKNTEHKMREEVMGLRQKAEKELQETLVQLRQPIEHEMRRLAGEQRDRIDRDFKGQHERFLKEVEAHTVFLQAAFSHAHGRTEEALRLYRKVVAMKPDHPVAWVKMGDVHRDLNRFEEALEAYQRALELDPNDPASHYHMAATYARQRRRDKMLETLALAIKNDGELKDEALNDPAFRDFWNDPAFKDLAEA